MATKMVSGMVSLSPYVSNCAIVREVCLYSSIGGRRTGGLERSLAMFLFFVIPAVSFLFARSS